MNMNNYLVLVLILCCLQIFAGDCELLSSHRTQEAAEVSLTPTSPSCYSKDGILVTISDYT